MKETYYVYRDGDEVHRLAKLVDAFAYGYDAEKKEWVEMQGLVKIQNEVTDYEEISKEEAEEIIKSL